MEDMLIFDHVCQYNEHLEQETLHPLVNVIDMSKCKPLLHHRQRFGDLIKKETGKSPQEHIQLKLIDTAKEKIFDPSKSISEVAYELGFKYPQHFTRLFKKVTGYSPNEYRQAN